VPRVDTRRTAGAGELADSYAAGDWRRGGTQGEQVDRAGSRAPTTARPDLSKKTAVIFPHVIWDATLFWGRDLFHNYETGWSRPWCGLRQRRAELGDQDPSRTWRKCDGKDCGEAGAGRVADAHRQAAAAREGDPARHRRQHLLALRRDGLLPDRARHYWHRGGKLRHSRPHGRHWPYDHSRFHHGFETQ
jgi:hypothetical protein